MTNETIFSYLTTINTQKKLGFAIQALGPQVSN